MRKNTKKVDIIIIAVIILLIACGVLLSLFTQNSGGNGAEKETISADTDGDGRITYKDYAGKTIGVGTGSMFDVLVEKSIPDAKLMYFNTYPDMVTALETGKTDAICIDEPVIRYIISTENHAVDYLKGPVEEYSFGFAFPKTEEGKMLRDEFNEFLRKIKTDGTMTVIENKWFSSDINKHTLPEIDNSSAENGVLRLGVESLDMPFVYLEGKQIVGYEVDIAYSFCKEYGYGLELTDMSFDAIIPSLISGMVDFGCSSMSITEERAESVYFSEPDYVGGAVLGVRTEDLSLSGSAGKASLPDFNGKTAGIITGSMHDALIREKLPDSPRLEYKNYSDLTEALTANKIDYFLMSRDGLTGLMAENDRIGFVDEPLDRLDVGAIFAKSAEGSKIRAQFNEFITKIKADGTLESIYEYWRSSEADGKSVDMSGLTGENGTLVFATIGDKPPVTYVAGGSIAGTDPDIAVRFCREYGYDIKVEIVDGGGFIPGVVSGVYDFAMSDFVITEERKESVDFSVPYSYIELFVTARIEDTAGTSVNENALAGKNTGFFESIAASFEKNFIREERWKLILEGIGTTCLITVLSAVSGSVLAFLICMFRRTGSRLANVISDIYVKLLQGTPIVVLLMILYYILLGKSGLEAVWVAVIGFTLNFGAYASEIMRSGIDSIDGGQREAALALGYSENQTFFRFIFPQAAVRFIPVYKQEIVSLLKSTSIVGYIAIQDLTKMSDIIRSRTYEAFFPLIATAIIYFLLAWVISLIVRIILTAFDKRHRKGIESKA